MTTPKAKPPAIVIIVNIKVYSYLSFFVSSSWLRVGFLGPVAWTSGLEEILAIWSLRNIMRGSMD